MTVYSRRTLARSSCALREIQTPITRLVSLVPFSDPGPSGCCISLGGLLGQETQVAPQMAPRSPVTKHLRGCDIARCREGVRWLLTPLREPGLGKEETRNIRVTTPGGFLQVWAPLHSPPSSPPSLLTSALSTCLRPGVTVGTVGTGTAWTAEALPLCPGVVS